LPSGIAAVSSINSNKPAKNLICWSSSRSWSSFGLVPAYVLVLVGDLMPGGLAAAYALVLVESGDNNRGSYFVQPALMCSIPGLSLKLLLIHVADLCLSASCQFLVWLVIGCIRAD